MGNCSFIVENKTIDITKNFFPLYNEINYENINYTWNDTFYLLKLEKQIDGISNYGILKGSKNGYECSGGLSECKDSCCLDGFCVEILYFCKKENYFVNTIYYVLGIFFLILFVIFWITYIILGCKYRDDFIKTMKEEEKLYSFLKIRKNGSGKTSITDIENYST